MMMMMIYHSRSDRFLHLAMARLRGFQVGLAAVASLELNKTETMMLM